jgi:hypothetical protein
MLRVILSLFCPVIIAIIIRVILFALAFVLALLGKMFNASKEIKELIENIGFFETFIWNDSYLYWGIVVIIVFIAEIWVWLPDIDTPNENPGTNYGGKSESQVDLNPDKELQIESVPNEGTSIVCGECKKTIPSESKYCPYCGCDLYVTCPQCGHKYLNTYPICNECGTNRDEWNQREREKRQEKLNALVDSWRKKYEENPENINMEDDLSEDDKWAVHNLKRKLQVEQEQRREEKLRAIFTKVKDPDISKPMFLTYCVITFLSFTYFFITDTDVHWGIKILKATSVVAFILFPLTIIYAIVVFGTLHNLFGSRDFILRKIRIKALKQYIQEHPDDIDIEFLRKKLNEMTP